MALIICKECRRQFSDLAQACPGCGAPTSYSLDASQPATAPVSPAPVVAPVFTVAAPELPAAEAVPLLSKPVAEPVAEPAAPSAYQFVVDHSAPADSMPGSKAARRQVGPLLVIGIFFLPWIFYWVLLRDGYGNLVRTLGFVWLLLCTAGGLALNYGLGEREQLPPVAQVPEASSAEQPKEDLSNPVFYPLGGQNGNVAATADQTANTSNNAASSTSNAALDSAGADTTGSAAAGNGPASTADNAPVASIYASSDDTAALQQNLSSCLQHEADTGRYSLGDNGKSVAKMISVCYSDFKPWFDQCMLDKNNAKSCNLDAIDMTTNILKLTAN